MDEEAEDRFTELARTRLADTLSEAARMLTAPADDPGDPEGPSVPGADRVGGRGFDDVLLGRTGRPPLGLVPAPAEERPAPGRAGGEAPIRLEPPAGVAVGAEVWELRAQVADLRGQVEHLQAELRTAVGRLASVAVATPEPSQAAPAQAAEPAAVAPPEPPAACASPPPVAAAPQAAPVPRSQAVPLPDAPPVPDAPPADGYTWAFTTRPRRRFWRRR